MTYLLYVAGFGAAATFFLWLRDARIFWRTALPGYRQAAYRGVLYSALSLFGFLMAYTSEDLEFLALGAVLLALYLQGRQEREKVWKGGENAVDRFLGTTGRR
ncbi:ABC transporter permease [Methanofollis aquaemaris]|uniref:ABC transporter permease n=1 Tax=Methanofollis aquaemaris TaxID=126734 RepID=A0A8A3S7T9_9EURY|nr:ABC transporter permease [Methanofollis aquaemaris]QSZ67919.1 ABC transporter permease [Methanofollis aquaemaris]